MRQHEEIILTDPSFLACHPTGSKVICNPPVLNTDEDWIVLCKDHEFLERLIDQGWGDCRDDNQEPEIDGLDIFGTVHRFNPYNEAGFIALRKGDLNLIVTHNVRFFSAFIEATELAKEMELNKKEQRVALFDYILKQVKK